MQDERMIVDRLPRHLKTSDYRRMPWKNGAGETVEIAIFPPHADLVTFGWRISMATVARDGAFSIFEGVDRTLSILEGDGMELAIAGRKATLLTPASDPLAFAADAPTTARLVSGSIVDLNVMTRQSQWRHQVERVTFDGSKRVSASGDIDILIPLGWLQIETADQKTDLGNLDCMVFDGEIIATADSLTSVYLIRIEAV